MTQAAGPALDTQRPSGGLATGDLDNDGDLDFIVVNTNTDAEIALNVTTRTGNFVSLWLEGVNCNRSAIGSVVTAQVGARRIVRQVLGASSYLSACDRRMHLGIGAAERIDELVIRWPDEREQTIFHLKAGAHYHVREGQDPVHVRPSEGVIAP